MFSRFIKIAKIIIAASELTTKINNVIANPKILTNLTAAKLEKMLKSHLAKNHINFKNFVNLINDVAETMIRFRDNQNDADIKKKLEQLLTELNGEMQKEQPLSQDDETLNLPTEKKLETEIKQKSESEQETEPEQTDKQDQEKSKSEDTETENQSNFESEKQQALNELLSINKTINKFIGAKSYNNYIKLRNVVKMINSTYPAFEVIFKYGDPLDNKRENAYKEKKTVNWCKTFDNFIGDNEKLFNLIPFDAVMKGKQVLDKSIRMIKPKIGFGDLFPTIKKLHKIIKGMGSVSQKYNDFKVKMSALKDTYCNESSNKEAAIRFNFQQHTVEFKNDEYFWNDVLDYFKYYHILGIILKSFTFYAYKRLNENKNIKSFKDLQIDEEFIASYENNIRTMIQKNIKHTKSNKQVVKKTTGE